MLWGRVLFDDNLIVEEAESVDALLVKIKQLLLDFHALEPDSYEMRIEYDLTAFFEQFNFLKITRIAEMTGLNGSLLRQYAAGKKHPSARQAERIEATIRQLALQLSEVHIYAH
ncbi:hypothetical protein HWI92_23680 [Dyadobacter sandarakinus]|uniref:XRE family transcriptional regulator n=2 Tax=Dyadobacter sandarakinus TaxID=2747268 RepID=A0ABX7IDU4_9BACT|nr:hypothetical protein HWI92_23680 [Dyadobacter sandarakinus]